MKVWLVIKAADGRYDRDIRAVCATQARAEEEVEEEVARIGPPSMREEIRADLFIQEREVLS